MAGRDGVDGNIVNTDDDSAGTASVPPSGPPDDGGVLGALVRLAALITGSPGEADLMEAVAEAARELLRADSLSVSRLEDDRRTLRTLINVGELGPGEQQPDDDLRDVGVVLAERRSRRTAGCPQLPP